MKCTQCGNTKLIKIRFGLGIVGDAYLQDPKFDTYVCTKCGHYELFATKFPEEYNASKAQLQVSKEKLESLQKQLYELKQIELTIDSKIQDIEKRLRNDSITVKEQRELRELLRVTQLRKRSLPTEIRRIEAQIIRVNTEISNLSKKL